MTKKQVWEPDIFDKDSKFKDLQKKNSHLTYVDAFSRQLKELFFIDYHEFIGQEKKQVYATEQFNKYLKLKDKDYCYVFYPWNGTVVKCVKENDYFRLKTNRNQDLITAEEQIKLYNYKVAVFGMSVGSNIACVLAQSAISKNIIIADFDELDTTNLNRIWAGVHQVGLNKTIVVARRIYEDNPFAKVTILEKGISSEILEKLLKDKKIDCIVEEIDGLPVKIDVRRLALKYKKPVLMITDNGDGVVLHSERYDLGYSKVFDNSFEYWDEKLKSVKSVADIGALIVNDVIGGPTEVDKRVIASVQRVMKRELVSWSQLGTAALYGGIVVCVAVKKIVSGIDRDLYKRVNLQPLP